MIEKIPYCTVCRGSDVVNANLPNPFHELLKCSICGHVFAPNIDLNDNALLHMQVEYFGEEFADRGGFFLDLYEHINANKTFNSLGSSGGRYILEIGPGSGSIMARGSRLGNKMQGLDLSVAIAHKIQKKWGLPVAVQSLSDHLDSVGSGFYDAIIMRHVLEHFPDPLGAVKNVFSLLKPRGKLYLAVPNIDSWHKRFKGWSGYQPYHFQYFCFQSIVKVLQEGGFSIITYKSEEPITGWINTCLNSMRKSRPERLGKESSSSNMMRQIFETVRLLAGFLLLPARIFQSYMGRGEEIVVLAQKGEK